MNRPLSFLRVDRAQTTNPCRRVGANFVRFVLSRARATWGSPLWNGDAPYRCRRSVVRVRVSVCWPHPWALQKRRNRSSCRSSCGLGRAGHPSRRSEEQGPSRASWVQPGRLCGMTTRRRRACWLMTARWLVIKSRRASVDQSRAECPEFRPSVASRRSSATLWPPLYYPAPPYDVSCTSTVLCVQTIRTPRAELGCGPPGGADVSAFYGTIMILV